MLALILLLFTLPLTDADRLRDRLTMGAAEAVAPMRVHADLHRFYVQRDFEPAWTEPAAALLPGLLREAAHDGLDPAAYGLDRLASLADADFDLLATNAVLTLADHLLRGRVDPADLYPGRWFPERRQRDGAALLAEALANGRPGDVLDAARPSHPQYAAMRHALAHGPAGHAEALRLNLERWRWLPDDLGDTHLFVNIPAQQLTVVEHGETVSRHRLVVGRRAWATPVLSDSLRSLTFNPEWAVPVSITNSSTIPAVRSQGVGYLRSRGFTVTDRETGAPLDPARIDWSRTDGRQLRMVQAAGPANPLGAIRFNLHNNLNIYIHDTNERALFRQTARALSHGCVRVEGATDLAAFMLRHWSDWQRQDVDRVIRERETVWVGPRDPWRVHLVYFTLTVEPDGSVVRHSDPYGYDAPLAAALAR